MEILYSVLQMEEREKVHLYIEENVHEMQEEKKWICRLKKYTVLGEESKLLHFVYRKTPFCKVPGKEPLEIPWPHPTAHEPIWPQTKISWLNAQELVVYLDNRDQIKNQHTTLRKKVTNQTFPYLKILFSMYTPYISNVIQNPGLLPIAAASVMVGAPARAW